MVRRASTGRCSGGVRDVCGALFASGQHCRPIWGAVRRVSGCSRRSPQPTSLRRGLEHPHARRRIRCGRVREVEVPGDGQVMNTRRSSGTGEMPRTAMSSGGALVMSVRRTGSHRSERQAASPRRYTGASRSFPRRSAQQGRDFAVVDAHRHIPVMCSRRSSSSLLSTSSSVILDTSEIRVLNRRVILYLRRRPLRDDRPTVEDDDAVGDVEDDLRRLDQLDVDRPPCTP